MAIDYERPPISSSPISALVPFTGPGDRLGGVVQALTAQLQPLGRDYEILLLDAEPGDALAAAVLELSAQDPRVHGRRAAKKAGYGAALRAGLEAARFPLVFTMPADLGYQPLDLHRLLQVIDAADLVAGYRRPRPWLETKRQGLLAFLGFGLRLKDPFCPVRMYRRSIFPRIPVQSAGRFADVEILAKANFLTCLMAEIDVSWAPPEPPPAWPGPSVWADAWRVFRQPDFGPPALEPAAPAAAAG